MSNKNLFKDLELLTLKKTLSIKSKWLVVFFQQGEGCDYSIGCGISTKLVDINEAESIPEQAKKLLVDYGNAEEISDGVYKVSRDTAECAIEFVLLVKLENFSLINVNELRKADAAFWQKKSDDAKLAAEVAQYERLKAKLGK